MIRCLTTLLACLLLVACSEAKTPAGAGGDLPPLGVDPEPPEAPDEPIVPEPEAPVVAASIRIDSLDLALLFDEPVRISVDGGPLGAETSSHADSFPIGDTAQTIDHDLECSDASGNTSEHQFTIVVE
jgi:hypothetical protein